MNTDTERDMIASLDRLEQRLKKTHVGFWNHLARSLVQGFFTAIGTIIGFAILLPISWHFIQQTEWEPIVDGWMDMMVEKIQEKQTNQMEAILEQYQP